MGRGSGKEQEHMPARITTLRLDDRQLPIPTLEQGFKHTYDQQRDLLLIVPTKGEKMNVMHWSDEEKPFRSLMLRPSTGRVVSVGYPKFFNYSEGPSETELMDTALATEQDVYYTEKLDGSLLIRSVIDGRVHLRTRGQIDSGEHGQEAWRVIKDKYPVLADPSFQSESSLLFELVSPSYRIVINYPEADLVLIGAVAHGDLSQLPTPQLQRLAADNQLRLVELVELPRDPKQLIETVAEWKDHEGVVARTTDSLHGEVLVKVKSADYLARHRLRFALSARVIREICLQRNVTRLEDFEEYLRSQGADWELVTDSKPLIQAFVDARASASLEFAEFSDIVQAKLKEFPDRKDFAQRFAVPLGAPLTAAAFSLLDGKEETAEQLILNSHLDQAFAGVEAKEQDLEE